MKNLKNLKIWSLSIGVLKNVKNPILNNCIIEEKRGEH